jgi:hypothetical protein
MGVDEDERPCLNRRQAYEVAYRFMAYYYDHERTVPLLQMLHAISWTGPDPSGNAEAWGRWMKCVQETLDGDPLPRLPPPWDQ